MEEQKKDSSNKSETLSNKPKRESNLPAKTKDKIMEIRKDPEVEKKRKERQLIWAKTGLQNFKHGRFAKFPLLFPDKDFANKVLGEEGYSIKEQYEKIIKSLEGFDIQDDVQIMAMLNDLLRVDIIRAAKNMIYEAMKGGVQDKALSSLIRGISERMIAILSLRKKPVEVKNYFFQLAEQIRNEFPEDKRRMLIEALRVEEGEIIDVKENIQNSQGVKF